MCQDGTEELRKWSFSLDVARWYGNCFICGRTPCKQSMNTKTKQFGAFVIEVTGHVCAVMILATVLSFIAAPDGGFLPIVFKALTHAELQADTFWRVAGHVGIALVCWGMLFGVFLAGRARMERQKSQAIRRPIGSVMTETIVLLPVFLLIVFGLAQLSVNNVGGILANVAVYEAARAGWVWTHEEGVRNVSSGESTKRARIAAAAVMSPVAPGNFMGNPILTGSAGKMRLALAASNLPVNDAYVSFIPTELQSLLASGGSLDLTPTTRKYQSVWRALDSDTFIQRTVKKFTHAHHATNIRLRDRSSGTEARLRYRHFIAMPMMGRVFGSFRVVGLRPGYYTTYERTYSFRSQRNNRPNARLPSNLFDSVSPSNSSEGDLRGEVGFWD